MARKLSRVAQHQLIVSIPLTAAAWSLGLITASAEEGVRATAQPAVIKNSFARQPLGQNEPPPTSASGVALQPAPIGPPATARFPALTSRTVEPSKLVTLPTAVPRIQKNPFARQPASPPPLDTQIMPGPISRWRQSVPIATEEQGVKSAILGAESTRTGELPLEEPCERSNSPWDRLPPAELMRDRLVKTGQANQWSPQRNVHPPDPIGFAPSSLSQPAWVVPDNLNGETSIAASARSRDDKADFDPFEAPVGEPGSNLNEPAAFVAAPHSNGMDLQSAAPEPPEPDMTSVIVSEYVDSPAGWHARAQQTAQAAQTSEHFTAVIQDCGRSIQAGAAVETVATVNRLAAWAYNRRGELAVEEGREQEAVRDFQSAIELDPECWLAIHNRGVTLAQQHELERALEDFNRVIELNPGLAIAYRNRAELLASLGRMEDAARDYDAAIDQLPEDAGLYLGRGYAFHRLGDFDRALADLNRVIELSGNLPEAYTQRGNLRAERGEFAEAVKDLETALQLDPNFAEAHRSAAWLLATCPDPAYRDAAQALAAAQQAVQLAAADDCFMLDALAAAHANAGQFDDAIVVQQQAIAAAPPDISLPLEHRLALYQQRRAFRSGAKSDVQAASHYDDAARPSPRQRGR